MSDSSAAAPEPDPDERWERLHAWLLRKLDQMEKGDFERLPASFKADGGRLAAHAYETVLVAMQVLEGRRTRGKQRAPTKTQVTLRLDADIVTHFRESGRGWQTRLNDTLRRTVLDN